MKYVVIKASGRQFKVKEGDEIELDKLDLKKGSPIDFKEVLLLVDGDKIKLGRPLVKEVVVKGKVISNYRGPKIRVAIYKAKSRYRRVKGFRPERSRVKIEKILLGRKKTSKSNKTGKGSSKSS